MPIIVSEKPEPCVGHKEMDSHLKAVYEKMNELLGDAYASAINNMFQDFENTYDDLVSEKLHAQNANFSRIRQD